MDSPEESPTTEAPRPPAQTRDIDRQPDYYARAIALWPRLDSRHCRARRDPRRVAALIARRTPLSREAILALLGAPLE
jgi:hypothetical protein